MSESVSSDLEKDLLVYEKLLQKLKTILKMKPSPEMLLALNEMITLVKTRLKEILSTVPQETVPEKKDPALETQALRDFAKGLISRSESADPKEKVVGLVAKYVSVADISGEEDGHIHTKKELIETALFKADEDLFLKFSQEKSFQDAVLADKDIEALAEKFVEIHMEIAHGGHHHHHDHDHGHSHEKKTSGGSRLADLLQMEHFSEQAKRLQDLIQALLPLKNSEKKSEKISGIFAEYMQTIDFSANGEFHSHNAEELVEECLTVYDREKGTQLLDEYLTDEGLQEAVLANESIQEIGKLYLAIHTKLPH